MKKFHGLSEKQFDALSNIAVGLDSGIHRKTAEILIEKGLIQEYREVSADSRFPVTVTRYVVPLGVHMEWCAFCDENFDENGEWK